MSVSPNTDAAPALPVVRPADLFDVFEQVVGVYAFTPCAYLGRPNESPHPGLAVEFKVPVRGAVTAEVVLRTTRGGARLLAEGIRPDLQPDDAACVDAFREVCNLFVGHLLTQCLGGQRRGFEPFLPLPCLPAAWPTSAPDAGCALLMESEPVELRYWQEGRP